MEIKMTREQYVSYLRTQAWWITELADEIEKGNAESTWAVDFDMLRPNTIKEENKVV